jgi:hypothetical protein
MKVTEHWLLLAGWLAGRCNCTGRQTGSLPGGLYMYMYCLSVIY